MRVSAGGRLFVGLDDYRELDVHVRVQVQLDLVLADHAERPVVHTHFAALDLDAELPERLGDVHGADGAEQLPFGAGLRR